MYGQPHTPPVIGTVMEDSAAAAAGLQIGDTIVKINHTRIDRFEEIRDIVIFKPEQTLDLLVIRDGLEIKLRATPQLSEFTDNLGNVHQIGLLGISVGAQEYQKLMVGPALIAAIHETYA